MNNRKNADYSQPQSGTFRLFLSGQGGKFGDVNCSEVPVIMMKCDLQTTKESERNNRKRRFPADWEHYISFMGRQCPQVGSQIFFLVFYAQFRSEILPVKFDSSDRGIEKIRDLFGRLSVFEQAGDENLLGC